MKLKIIEFYLGFAPIEAKHEFLFFILSQFSEKCWSLAVATLVLHFTMNLSGFLQTKKTH
jgi:hypothetical protein